MLAKVVLLKLLIDSVVNIIRDLIILLLLRVKDTLQALELLDYILTYQV
jgi:hypothetical protein